MGALSTFKGMKVEESFSGDEITFRTSRVCRVLGFLFFTAGIGIIFQLLIYKLFFTLFSFCVFCFVVAFGFMFAGVILMSYKKKVVFNKAKQKFELSESSILGVRKASYHFNEVLNFELTKSSECIFSNKANLWVVKAYFKYHNDFTVEKIFTSLSPLDAKDAAEVIGYIVNKEVVISCQPEEKLNFIRA